MLDYKKVLHNNIFYKLGRKLIVDFWFNTVFFRKVVVLGKENIPKEQPVLIAPIHRNAFIDDAAVLCTRNDEPVFLARADIFENKLLARFFIFLRMVPVFRIRDGKHKLANNEMTFDVGSYVLENNKILTVFPEAAHTEFNRMLPLKKGAIRIAFLAAQKTDFKKDIFIVPTGLYYDNIFNYRHKVLVLYGKPINILNYKDLYLESPQKAMLKVRADLNKELIKLSIHIENEQYYEQINKSREIFDHYVAQALNKKLGDFKQKFEIDKKTIEVLEEAARENPSEFDTFANKVNAYFEQLKRNNLRDYLFENPWSWTKLIATSILSILFLPILLVLWINFAIPICIPELIVNKFKDRIFHASVRFIASLFLVLIWSLVGGIILGIIFKWWIGILFFLAQPFLLILWLDYRRLLKKVIGNWRFCIYKAKFEPVKALREELVSLFQKFFIKFVDLKKTF